MKNEQLLKKLEAILDRNDILELNNDRVDTLRLFFYLVKNNGKVSNFVKFLKTG